MFIQNTKDNIVSTKKILSPYKSNFIKLRYLYNNYIIELKNINNNKIYNKLYNNINDAIIKEIKNIIKN